MTKVKKAGVTVRQKDGGRGMGNKRMVGRPKKMPKGQPTGYAVQKAKKGVEVAKTRSEGLKDANEFFENIDQDKRTLEEKEVIKQNAIPKSDLTKANEKADFGEPPKVTKKMKERQELSLIHI